MSQREEVLWDSLLLMHEQEITITTTELRKDPSKRQVSHAIGASELRGKLVLKYKPADIEDTIYFLKNRDYLVTETTGVGGSDFVYSLTEKALDVAKQRKLPNDEEKAFKEALWDIKPGVWGIRLNLLEILRRGRKKFSK